MDPNGRKFVLDDLFEIDISKRESRAIHAEKRPISNVPFPKKISDRNIEWFRNKIHNNNQEVTIIKTSINNKKLYFGFCLKIHSLIKNCNFKIHNFHFCVYFATICYIVLPYNCKYLSAKSNNMDVILNSDDE